MNYKIYQLNIYIEGLMFRPYIESKFNFNNYKEVYSGTLENVSDNIFENLEKIYTKFNINHPDDFVGHSLSVSDLVEINNELYYCDRFGWTKVNK